MNDLTIFIHMANIVDGANTDRLCVCKSLHLPFADESFWPWVLIAICMYMISYLGFLYYFVLLLLFFCIIFYLLLRFFVFFFSYFFFVHILLLRFWHVTTTIYLHPSSQHHSFFIPLFSPIYAACQPSQSISHSTIG